MYVYMSIFYKLYVKAKLLAVIYEEVYYQHFR